MKMEINKTPATNDSYMPKIKTKFQKRGPKLTQIKCLNIRTRTLNWPTRWSVQCILCDRWWCWYLLLRCHWWMNFNFTVHWLHWSMEQRESGRRIEEVNHRCQNEYTRPQNARIHHHRNTMEIVWLLILYVISNRNPLSSTYPFISMCWKKECVNDLVLIDICLGWYRLPNRPDSAYAILHI